MAYSMFEITTGLMLLLGALVHGEDFHFHDHDDSFGSYSFHNPWFDHHHHEFLDSAHHHRAESQLVPQYQQPFFHSDPLVPSSSATAAFKKAFLSEDKNSKKPVSPYYSLAEMNSPKFKEVFKSGAPRCQEISAKDSTARMTSGELHHPSAAGDRKVTCYRCKDPINGSTFEQCSYTSQKPQALKSNTADSLTAASDHGAPRKSRKVKKPKNQDFLVEHPYKFAVDYFQPEALTKENSSAQKETATAAATDGCERIVRNSMVCMVCRDPKTNGKYEQCSYQAQPNEKAFSYTKSSSFGNPKNRKSHEPTKPPKAQKLRAEPVKDEEDEEEETLADDEPEEQEETNRDADHQYYQQQHDDPEDASDYGHEESSASGSNEDKEGHYTYNFPSYHDTYGGGEAESYEQDDSKQDAKASDGSCKTVRKDGQNCKICTNPKTGGESERCEYAHEPKDKVYKYSKSNSFGYPENQSSGGGDDDASSSSSGSAEKLQQDEDAGSAEDYYSSPSFDHIRTESEKISKQRAKDTDKNGCRKVRRDSMTCTICKDPKTGEDSEQCNYSYEPDDKVYAYTKSKSFGGPNKGSGYSDEERPEESIIYPTGTSVLDYIPKTSESRVHATKEQKPNVKGKKPGKKGVDSGFDDAKVRRAEIEKIVKDMDTEDKSKCKKVKRGDMTCYRCTDGKGSTNEECVFVADPDPEDEEPSSVATTVHAGTTLPTTFKLKHITRRTRETRRDTSSSSSAEEDDDTVDEEETHEAEPYDYVAETRPVYDKVLGLTLPAYMLTKSPHEIEFDKFVENSHI